MSSSKILPGCLVSLAAVAVFYLSWVALPSVRSEDKVNELLARQKQLFEADQKLAGDARQNAFIDPQLSLFWGRRSVEHQPQSQLGEAVMAMSSFGFLSQEPAGESGIPALRRQGSQSLDRAVGHFTTWLPVVRGALRRSAFILPSSKPPDFESEGPSLLGLRSMAQGLSAYAEVQLADGKPSEALEAALNILTLAKLIVSQKAHPLITTMIASAVQSTGQDTLGYLLQTSPDWSEADLERMLAALRSSAVSAQMGVECMEYDLWVAENAFAQSPDPKSGRLLRFPGVWRREWRLYQNDYFPPLELARAGHPPSSAQMPKYTALSWFLGQRGFMSQLTMPNFERVTTLLDVSRQRQDFLHLYVQLLLQKRQGRLPKELSSQGLGTLDPAHLSYRVEKGEPSLQYDLNPGLAQGLPKASGVKRNGAARWENLMQARWALPVAP